jgi:hypothetical protein
VGLFSFVGSLIGGNKQAKASKEAARLQYDATMAGINESKRQFDVTRADYQPYQDLGKSAIDPLGNLVGTNGAAAQQGIIDQLKGGPLYTSLIDSGEEALLANASATGGLRGGNTQDALARFRGDTLNSVIANQLSQYAGLVGIGSGATDAVSNFGANAVNAQNQLRNQGAAAQAQSALIRGGIAGQSWKNAGSTIEDIIKGQINDGQSGFNWKLLF